MELTDLLDARHSCRAILPGPVDAATIDAVLARAQRTPSWCNTQPWQVHLLSGEPLAAFAKVLTEQVVTAAAEGRAQRADLGVPTYTGVHAERRRESGHGLYAHLGIAREDRLARGTQMLQNFSFFGAPHTLVVTTDRDLGSYGVLDCGAYVQVLQLLLADVGLGVVAQGAIGMYSDVVREQLHLTEDRLVVCAVSFGHPDPDAAVNGFRTSRVDLDEVVRVPGGERPDPGVGPV